MRLREFFPVRAMALAAASGLGLFQSAPLALADISAPKDNLAIMLSSNSPTDAHVAEVVGELLQTWHYSQHPFDAEMAGRFLDRYLDTLDYSHLYFLQSDLDEFNAYRTNLDVLTMRNHDISPCWKIFARFMQRATEHTAFVTNALETEKFDFNGHDRYIPNRHTLPNPKDLNDAHQIWQEELRAEYLQHLLSTPDIEFTGAIERDGHGRLTMQLTNDLPPYLAHLSGGKPLAALYHQLPEKFYNKDHHEIAWLEMAPSQTNGIIHLRFSSEQILKKTTNHFYSPQGEDLGDFSFHRIKPEGTNVAAVPRNALSPTNFDAEVHLNKKDLVEVHYFLTNHYVQVLKNYKDLDRDRVFEIYMNSLARAYDPHSDYMGHMQAENFAIQMKLSLFGIGAILSMKDEYCTIDDLKDGPAQRSNQIKPGDRIVAVAQSNAPPVDVRGMPLDKVVEMIRGPKGTQVTLTIWPAESRDPSFHKVVTLVRDEIKLEDQAPKATLFETPAGENAPPLRIGVIDLSSFYADNDSGDSSGHGAPTSTSEDVKLLIQRLKKEHVDGIILDLRRNGGGYLDQAIKLTGLFIPSGPVVQTKDPTGEIVTDRCLDRTVLYDGPLIVLTSRPYTASASEIFAGAIQDYNRGLIVGDYSTFGKGTVQTMQPLRPFLEQQHLSFNYDPGALKVTIKKFYRAGGKSTQLEGVLSDIALPSIFNYASNEVGESSLPNALPCDEVSSAGPVNLNRVAPFLAELKKRSEERVAASQDFKYVQQDIAQYLKEQADKSISLNESVRLAEQKADQARDDARRHERLARKKPDQKVYEITLKNVDLAALQPPPAKTNTVATATPPDADDDDSDVSADDQSANIDPQLDETRRIMADYIALYNGGTITSTTPKTPVAGTP